VSELNQHPEAAGRNAKPAQAEKQQQNLTNLNHPSESDALTLIVNLIPPPQPDQYPSTDILHDPKVNCCKEHCDDRQSVEH
jgi:hypothetical protein